jgi:hypothetical protein
MSRNLNILEVCYFVKLLLRTLDNIIYIPGLQGWALAIKEWYIYGTLSDDRIQK